MPLGFSLGITRPYTRLPATSTPLRIAEVQARSHSNISTMINSLDTVLIRMPFVIGQDMKDILLSFMNWYQTTTAETDTGNSLTIQSCAIESTTGTVAPVYFSGVRIKVLANGDNDIQSDIIPPSSFGLSKFTRGEQYWIKAIITVGVTNKIPRSADLVSAVAGSQVGWYQASATTPSSTDVTGAYTVTGTALNSQPSGFQPVALGHPVTDGPSYITIGDSIGEGSGDTGYASVYGYGYVQRAMGNGGTAPLPCLNFCKAGSSSDLATTGTKWRSYIKYARYCVEEYGTNDFVVMNKTVSAAQTSLSSLWTILRGEGIQKIIKPELICYTQSTDNWATAGNQNVRTNWGVGEKSDQLNTWIQSKVSDSTIDYAVTFGDLRDASSPNKWATDGNTAFLNTTDGLHPSSYGHTIAATQLRSILTTIGV